MFEKEIKFISDFCLNKIKYLGSSFTFEEVSATDLHPAILRYISAEFDFMIYADRKKLLQESYFDYSGREISEHFKHIAEEIKRTKRISVEDAQKLILQAVSFNASYVVMPKWSLSKLIYQNQNSVTVGELDMMLNYIHYYDYIKNVLAAYLSKRRLIQLTQTEFDLIFNKIDRELFKTNSEQLINDALVSIGDFFNIGGVDKSRISPAAVEILLKEKNMMDLLMKFRKTIPDTAKKKYDIEDIKRVLYSPAPVEPDSLTAYIEELEPSSDELITEMPEAADTKEEKPVTDESETSLAELAEKHAEEIEKADVNEIISPDEEEKLMEMYDEQLNEPSENTEEHSDAAAEEIDIDEKEIVDEMMKDYFGEETEKEEPLQTGEENILPEIEEQLEQLDEELQVEEEKIKTLEDELMEVFDEIDMLEKSSDETETPPAADEVELPIDELDEITEPEELDEIDRDLATIDEIAFSDESSVMPAGNGMKQQEEDSNITGSIEKELEELDAGTTLQVTEEESTTEEKPEEEVPPRQNDLFSYLKKREIKKIISKIFGKDEEDFISTAEKIMQCHTYKEASDILKAVFSSYKVSPFSKEGVIFTNAVSNYFRQE